MDSLPSIVSGWPFQVVFHLRATSLSLPGEACGASRRLCGAFRKSRLELWDGCATHAPWMITGSDHSTVAP